MAAIKYKQLLKPENLNHRFWKVTVDGEQSISAISPKFTGNSIEELFYCEDRFERHNANSR